MSIRKIIALAVIYILGWAGWWTLGTITSLRSNNFSSMLGPRVEGLWGTDLSQKAPSFSIKIPGTTGTDRMRWMMPVKNKIAVDISPDYRKKGLLWYSTYNCSFDGVYTIRNSQPVTQKVYLHFDFPAKGATYDEFSIHLDDNELSSSVDTREGIDEIIELAPGKEIDFRIHYKTRGMNTWQYLMAENIGRVQNFSLTANTGFKSIDFTRGSLSPMTKIYTPDNGMALTWEASDLITNGNIGIIIPEKLNPGPLTTRITYFAPVCLLFFFILIATIGIMRKIDIHPMHYLFVTAGFFAFHLLLSYLAGHVWIHIAFILSAIVSVFLVTSYLSAALGNRFPWKIAIAGQLFFLVLFSYTFFIKGITGLIVATGTVVTLGILMKVTADVNWDQVFQSKKKQERKPAACIIDATDTPR